MDIMQELEKYLLTEAALNLDKKSINPNEDLLHLSHRHYPSFY